MYTKAKNVTTQRRATVSSISRQKAAFEVAKVVNGKPVKYVYDTVSEKNTQQTALALLHDGGHLALLLQAAVEIPKNTVVIQVFGGYNPDSAQILSTLYHDNLYDLLEQDVIKVDSIYSLLISNTVYLQFYSLTRSKSYRMAYPAFQQD